MSRALSLPRVLVVALAAGLIVGGVLFALHSTRHVSCVGGRSSNAISAPAPKVGLSTSATLGSLSTLPASHDNDAGRSRIPDSTPDADNDVSRARVVCAGR